MKADSLNPFGKRLKQARITRGLSQKQLGIQAGIDQFVASARMNQYEKNVHIPNFATVYHIATVLNLPTAYFFCIEDDLAEHILEWTKQQ